MDYVSQLRLVSLFLLERENFRVRYITVRLQEESYMYMIKGSKRPIIKKTRQVQEPE